MFIVSAVNAEPGLFSSDIFNPGKTIEHLTNHVDNFLNLTEAAFMDVSQFTMDMAKKYFEAFKVR